MPAVKDKGRQGTVGSRVRKLLALGVLFVVALSAIRWWSARLVVAGFRDVEEAEACRNVERAAAAVRQGVDRLADRAKVWACLPETCQFVEGRDQGDVERHLHRRGLHADLELNAVVFSHVSGRIVYAEGWPPDARRGVSTPESLLACLTSDSTLLRPAHGGAGSRGILSLPEGLLLVGVGTIVDRDAEDPPCGTLLLGRFLDARMIRDLSAATKLKLRVRRLTGVAAPAGATVASARGHDGVQVGQLDDETLMGSVCLRDVHGRPAAVLEVETPRQAFRHAEARLARALAWPTAAGGAFGVAALWLLSRLMVSGQAWRRRTGVQEASRSGEHLERLVEERSRSLLNAEHQLLQQEKLASVGQLAAGIAHEINTPIQYIGDNLHALASAFDDLITVEKKHRELVQMVKEGTATPDAVQAVEEVVRERDVDYIIEDTPKAISQSLEGVRRVSHIVRAMKDFSHIDRGEVSAVDVNHALENTLTIARNEYKYVADVETDFGELPPVECYGSELNQVFLNILVNAAHAIGDTGRRGKISIRTRLVGESVEISIADSGTGIPDEIRNRIFEPFFTTKEVGRGTGQGLSIAHQIVVAKHHGSLTFDSRAGQGTTFTIRLPVRASVGDTIHGARG